MTYLYKTVETAPEKLEKVLQTEGSDGWRFHSICMKQQPERSLQGIIMKMIFILIFEKCQE